MENCIPQVNSPSAPFREGEDGTVIKSKHKRLTADQQPRTRSATALAPTSPKVPLGRAASDRKPFLSPSLQKYSENKPFSPNSHWSSALRGMKDTQQTRFLDQRTKAEVEDGLAQKRISAFQEVAEPTAAELGATWRAIRPYLADAAVLTGIDRHVLRGPERFILGDTHLYAAANCSATLNTYLHTLGGAGSSASSRERYTPLGGIGRGHRVVALAARGCNDQYYLAISIHPIRGAGVGAGAVSKVTLTALPSCEVLADMDFILSHRGQEVEQHYYTSEEVDSSDEEEDEEVWEETKEYLDLPLNHPENAPRPMSLAHPADLTDMWSPPPTASLPDLSELSVLDTQSLSPALPLPAQGVTWAVPGLLSSKSQQSLLQQHAGSSNSTSTHLDLDITAVRETGSCDKLFLAVRPGTGAEDNCTIVTSTMRQMVTASSKCVVESNHIYEWIRGVSKGGWLHKFPSSYNGIGAPHKRYFILRDNLLCYYPDRPVDEEDYSCGKVLPLGEDTKLEVCTHLLSRCVKICPGGGNSHGHGWWIRLGSGQRGDAWLQALQDCINVQTTKRMSLTSTIKTLWFPPAAGSCEIISVDAGVLDGGAEGYVKVALYRHSNGTDSKYMMDIIVNEEKIQVELVLSNETPYSSPASPRLQCVKLYGDKVLLGGERGFIGVGTLGSTTDLSLGDQRKVLYVLPAHSNSSASSKGNQHSYYYAGEASPPPVYHSSSSTVLFFAYSNCTDLFVAVDDKRVCSLWHLPRGGHMQVVKGGKGMLSPPSKPGHIYSNPPEHHSSFALNQLDMANSPAATADEMMTSAGFLPSLPYLLLATSRRLILLEVSITMRGKASAASNGRSVHGNGIPEDNSTRGSSNSGSGDKYRIVGWNILDSVSSCAQIGLFALNVLDPPLPRSGSGSTGKGEKVERTLSHRSLSFMERKVVHWRATSYEGATPGCLLERSEWTPERFNHFLRTMRPI